MSFGFASTITKPQTPLSAALQLTFAGATSLDSRITFARADATTCATYFDSTGRLQTAAANIPRFDYDPATPAGVTGGELATNGGFGQGSTGWTVGSEWTVSSSVASVVGTGLFTNLDQTVAGSTVGKRYRLSFTVLAISGGALRCSFGTNPIDSSTTTTGAKSIDFVAQNSLGLIRFQVGSGVSATITNVSVQELSYSPRGLLIEESRQNRLLHSRDMTQSAWAKTDVTPARTQVGLDGVANTACLMTEGTLLTAVLQQYPSTAVTAGSTITASVVLKRGNTDWIRVSARETTGTDGANAWFNLNTGAKGTVSAAGAGTNNSSTITPLGGGWYRCTVTTTPNGTYTLTGILINSATADGNGTRVSGATYIVDCAQIEVGAFATSIIPTTTTSLTRAADSASMTGTNFSSWFNQSAGTFVAESDQVNIGAQMVIHVDDGSTNNRIYLNTSGGGRSFVCEVATIGQASLGLTGALSVNTPSKSAAAYAVNDFAGCTNGGTVNTDTSGTLPTVSAMLFGVSRSGAAASYLNGHIRRLTYYPTRLPNATLQALTA